jgi:hypothetical protein
MTTATLSPEDIQKLAHSIATVLAKDWFGPEDAAAYLDLSPQYLAQLRMKKTGPEYHLVGRRCIYRKSDLNAWMASHRGASNA